MAKKTKQNVNSEYKKNIRTLEASVKMYENTINEMKERGDDTILVEQALEETKHDLEVLVSNEERVDCGEFKKDMGVAITAPILDILNNKPIAVEFLNNSRWMVKIGDFPEWLVSSFAANSNKFLITFRECDEFCAMKYFDEHKKFNSFKVQHLDPTGAIVRTDIYSTIKVKSVSISSQMVYGNDDILTTTITGTFKKRTICLNR